MNAQVSCLFLRSGMVMERDLFDTGHHDFRVMVRDFVAKEVEPHLPAWEQAGAVDRGLYMKAGEVGLLGLDVDEPYGGGGVADFRYSLIITEELCRAGASSLTMNISGFNDLVAPYLTELGTEEQKRRWLPGLCAGRAVSALAMTEPGTGSGENIYPAEVEQVILQHPAVAECAVISLPDEQWGEVGRAVVVPRPGTDPAPGDVLGFLNGKLARYKIPKSVVFAAELPRNTTGKVAKASLQEPTEGKQ